MKTLMLTAALALFTGLTAPRAHAEEMIGGYVTTVRMDYETGRVVYFQFHTRLGDLGVYLDASNAGDARVGYQVLRAYGDGAWVRLPARYFIQRSGPCLGPQGTRPQQQPSPALPAFDGPVLKAGGDPGFELDALSGAPRGAQVAAPARNSGQAAGLSGRQ